MAKRGWIPNRRDLAAHAEEVMRDLIRRAGGEHVLPVAFYRKNNHARRYPLFSIFRTLVVALDVACAELEHVLRQRLALRNRVGLLQLNQPLSQASPTVWCCFGEPEPRNSYYAA
jgi:hypothetical protein